MEQKPSENPPVCDQPRGTDGEASDSLHWKGIIIKHQQVTWSLKQKKGASPSLAGLPVCGLYEVASACLPAQQY